MSLSQMKVFNEYIMPATIETLAQEVDKFNASSNGAIRLTTSGFTGDFLQESFFASLASAQRRVDRHAANAAATPTDLTQLQLNGVKVAGGFGPVRYEPSQMTWLEHPTTKGIEVASRTFASLLLRDQLNSAVSALAAAISNNAGVVNDVSATAGITQSAINTSHAKFGDASGNLVASVMTGAMFHRLIGLNLLNATQLYKFDSVQIVDIFGKAVVVTDAPALTVTGTPNKDLVLTLAEGAAIVYDGGDVISNVQTTNGNARIETTLQVDYSFGLALKGYSWDTAAGGKSPTDAKIGTGSNWVKVATSNKHTAGVVAIGDQAK